MDEATDFECLGVNQEAKYPFLAITLELIEISKCSFCTVTYIDNFIVRSNTRLEGYAYCYT